MRYRAHCHNGTGFVGKRYDIGRTSIPELDYVLGLLDEILDVYETVQTHGEDEYRNPQLSFLGCAFGIIFQMRTEQGNVHLVLTVALHARYEGRIRTIEVCKGNKLKKQLVLQAFLFYLLSIG